MNVDQTCSARAKLKNFISEALGRLTFEDFEQRFRTGFEANPVFRKLGSEDALSRNVVVVVGGRGSGKTLLLRYIKLRLEADGWDFRYILGGDVNGSSFLSNVTQRLEQDREYRVAVAVDDLVEVDDVLLQSVESEIRKAVERFGGRVKFIITAQSEHPEVLAKLKIVLRDTRITGGFDIARWLEESYFRGQILDKARGAVFISLDAFWATYRSLSKVRELGEAIVGVLRFYGENSGASRCPDYDELLKEVEEVKEGLALKALAGAPMLVEVGGFKVITEYYRSGYGALNGQGMAELLLEYLTWGNKGRFRALAQLYRSIESSENAELTVSRFADTLKRAVDILKSRSAAYLSYLEVLEGSIYLLSEKCADQPQRHRGRPSTYLMLKNHKFNTTAVIQPVYEGGSWYSYQKIRKLVDCGIPDTAGGVWLIVLCPKAECLGNVLSQAPRLANVGGFSVISLSNLNKLERAAVIKFLDEISNNNPTEHAEVLARIVLWTLPLKLFDTRGAPRLAYFLLPAQESGISPPLSG